MGMGYLKVETFTAFEALPVAGAEILVKSAEGEVLYQLGVDDNGVSDVVSLYAPDASHTLSPDDPGPFYASYNVEILSPGYETVTVYGVQVFDTETSVLPVEMTPATRGSFGRDIIIPDNDLHECCAWMQEGAQDAVALGRFLGQIIIPETITVHLGAPTTNARNVRVPFAEYIKNVASSEIYPTWPQASLEANIYCQITFALNRVYTEWYPSRGYNFHITSSTAFDQSFVEGRNIYANISEIVDNIFNIFVRRQGYAEPYFTAYCNGTTVTCAGLSQWGTVPLAQQGMSAFSILRNYYPADIELVQSNLVQGIEESYPGTPLRVGSRGTDVSRMQFYLNRIRINYPLIPEISPVDGSYGPATYEAVRVFQQTFNLTADGIIGKATWYKIIQIYNGVKKLAELDGEGERIGIGAAPPTSVLRVGSRGSDVVQLQFLLNYIGEFYAEIPVVLENSSFDERTRLAVVAFQQRFGLGADGVVGPATWNKLYEIYHSIDDTVTVPPEPGAPGAEYPDYPGELLRSGSRGEPVRTVQRFLNRIFRFCPGFAALGEDGIFGNMTHVAVVAFQGMQGLSQDGIVGPATWSALVEAYNSSL